MRLIIFFIWVFCIYFKSMSIQCGIQQVEVDVIISQCWFNSGPESQTLNQLLLFAGNASPDRHFCLTDIITCTQVWATVA